jgi:hypothetical protein
MQGFHASTTPAGGERTDAQGFRELRVEGVR